MALVAPVNLPYNIKTLWFEPGNNSLALGDKVVVKTSRGQELGVMASDLIDVTDEQIQDLKSPLMPVLRIATDEDLSRAKEMEEKSKTAMEVFKKLARQTSEQMHPVSVEYMLDGEKAVFYFESEERIDFRELVRKLASEFHVRIDMRQIGVRDEARIIGGIAHCGQVVCCKRLGGEFKPVSIRMAKEQDMSLNPSKISGLCGRLMCCLRYESDLYSEFKKTVPKMGAQISTPDGMGKVIEIDVPKEEISIRIEDEKPIKVPVSMIEDMPEDRKTARIADGSWEVLKEDMQSAIFERGGIFDLPKFTSEDKLGTAKAVHHERPAGKGGHAKKTDSDTSSKGARKPRGSKRRSVKIALGGNDGSSEHASTSDKDGQEAQPFKGSRSKGNRSGRSRKNDQRKSSSRNSGDRKPKGRSSQKNSDVSKEQSNKLRPGHKSSGLSQGGNGNDRGSSSGRSSKDNKGGNRRRRRRGSSSKGNSDHQSIHGESSK